MLRQVQKSTYKDVYIIIQSNYFTPSSRVWKKMFPIYCIILRFINKKTACYRVHAALV